MRFVSFLIKPASEACDLRCRYCFYEDETRHRAVKNMGMMGPETVQALLRQSFALAEPGGTVSFTFQGGEPTLAGLGFFRAFTDSARALCPPGVEVRFSIQTNGTMLDEDWAVFFRENGYLAGLSLDGTQALHDLYRRSADGRGSWSAAVRAARLLQRHRVPVNALCVVTAQCARQPEAVYDSLKALGFGYMQFIPCLDPIGRSRGGESYSLTPGAYGAFLCRLFDAWYLDWLRGDYHSVRLFDDHVNLLMGAPASACATLGQCGGCLVAEADGGVYPCDFFVLDRWRLGRLGSDALVDMAAGPTAAAFLAWGAEKPAPCGGCRWRPLCAGGCKNDWTDGENGPENYFCPAFRRYFPYAIGRLEHMADVGLRSCRAHS